MRKSRKDKASWAEEGMLSGASEKLSRVLSFIQGPQ